MANVNVTIDGTRYTDEVEPRLLFVHYLRDRLGLTGTNIGCDTSNCGACTVLVDGRSAKSCTMLAVQADGSEVTTIQGLAASRLGRDPAADGAAANGGAGNSAAGSGTDTWHPLQRAFHEQHGLQCGYCTPGMIMASVDLLGENPEPTDDEIREGIEGNLCRCTGYENIVRAIQQAAGELRGEAASRTDTEVAR